MAPEMRCALTTFSARSGRSSIPFLARGRSSPVVIAHTGPTGCVSQIEFRHVVTASDSQSAWVGGEVEAD